MRKYLRLWKWKYLKPKYLMGLPLLIRMLRAKKDYPAYVQQPGHPFPAGCLWARLTDGDDEWRRFAWTAVRLSAETGEWEDIPNGPRGSFQSHPAYADPALEGVPIEVPAVVLLRRETTLGRLLFREIGPPLETILRETGATFVSPLSEARSAIKGLLRDAGARPEIPPAASSN
ncbi:hypothetical protein ACYOEI_01580 [Singulisphaera rosea]